MNILPKKRWHVRTRENIARVRRDEAKAAEEEKEKQRRIEIAEREARTTLLRAKAREQYKTGTSHNHEENKVIQRDGHVNLFYNVEQNSFAIEKSNPEYEKEKKLEREKYEKQIGYLTYLGQDTNEITGNVSWYNKNPEERQLITEEVSKVAKALEDPLRDIQKYLGCKGVHKIAENVKSELYTVTELNKNILQQSRAESTDLRKKEKDNLKKYRKKKKKRKKRKYSSDSDSSETEKIVKKKVSPDLSILRAERLKREMAERKRAELVLHNLNRGKIKEEKSEVQIEQRYNSQFNPHIAKQNQLKSDRFK